MHGGVVPGFVMNEAGTFQKDAMLRQITASVVINEAKESELH